MDQERVGDQGIEMVPKNEQSYYFGRIAAYRVDISSSHLRYVQFTTELFNFPLNEQMPPSSLMCELGMPLEVYIPFNMIIHYNPCF